MSKARVAGFTVAALFFGAANGVDYLSLDPDQVWILKRIMRFMGLGLFVVATVGVRVSRWFLKILKRLDGWILQSGARAGFLLALLILGYFVLYGGVSFLRHYYFYSGYDLASQDQVVWNATQGHLFSRSLEVSNDLGDHVRPYLPLVSLIYLIIPSPYVLLGFQSFVLALSAWPLYSLARRKFDSPAIGLAVAFCALAYPPLGFLNRFDFHTEVITVPLLIAAYERIDVRDLKSASLFMGLALLGKENVGLTVAALGVMVALYYRHWRFGFIWASAGFGYSLVTLFVVIPVFRGTPSDTLMRYHWLGDTPLQMSWTILSQPNLILEKMLAVGNVLTMLQLLAPLAFLPLLSISALLPIVPALIYNFLSELASQRTIYYHYMAPVIPFICISAVVGLRDLTASKGKVLLSILPRELRSDETAALGIILMLVATLASWNYQNPIIGNTSLASVATPREVRADQIGPSKSVLSVIRPNDAAIRDGLKHVPDDVYLLTTNNYLPHLSHRRKLEGIPWASATTVKAGVEAIFLNLNDLRRMSCDTYLGTLKTAARLGFGVSFHRDGVLVIEKDRGNAREFNDLLANWPACE